MICLIALVVFGILGIFSATHRKIAREALDCVFRRLTIRKCTSGLDKRLKSQITGKLMSKSPRLAKFTYRNFELISWVLTILMVLSLFYTGLGIYNFAKYGNCNGAGSSEACFYNGLTNILDNNQPNLTQECGGLSCSGKTCACENKTECQERAGPCNKSCGE